MSFKSINFNAVIQFFSCLNHSILFYSFRLVYEKPSHHFLKRLGVKDIPGLSVKTIPSIVTQSTVVKHSIKISGNASRVKQLTLRISWTQGSPLQPSTFVYLRWSWRNQTSEVPSMWRQTSNTAGNRCRPLGSNFISKKKR